jgi:hypothetical protein
MNPHTLSQAIEKTARDGGRKYQIKGIVQRLRDIEGRLRFYEMPVLANVLRDEIAALEELNG